MRRKSKAEDIYICVCVWLIHFAVQQKLTQHCKATIIQWKISKINRYLLMFLLPGLCCKTPIYPGSSLTSSEQSLRTIWEANSQAWNPQKVHQTKQLLTFRLCVFFSRQYTLRITLVNFSSGEGCKSCERAAVFAKGTFVCKVYQASKTLF